MIAVMAMPRFLATQFGLPRGALGRLVGRLMARTNEQTTRALVDRLDAELGASDAVLEIGFGPGVGITRLAERLATGQVCGIDPSAVMLAQARERARPFAARVDLREGSSDSLPWPEDTFDVVLSTNSVQLWSHLAQSVGEAARVLKPSGHLGLALHQRAVRFDGTFVDAAFLGELDRVLTATGFEDVRTGRVTVRGGYATLIDAAAPGQ